MQLTMNSHEACALLAQHLKIDSWNISIVDVAQRPPKPKPFNFIELIRELNSLKNLRNTKRPDGSLYCVKIERIKHFREIMHREGLHISLTDAKQTIEFFYPNDH